MTKKSPDPSSPPELPIDYMTGLTRPQQNRLLKFHEDLGAVQQAAAKCLLYGYEQRISTVYYSNRGDLEIALGRLMASLRLITRKGDLDNDAIMQRMVIQQPLTQNAIPREREDDHLLDVRHKPQP